jgi:hypothetical protein
MALQVVSNEYQPTAMPLTQQLPCLVRNRLTGDILLARKSYSVAGVQERNISLVVLQPSGNSDLDIGQQVSQKESDFENSYLLHEADVTLRNETV